MCVGFTSGWKDYTAAKVADAIKRLVPGSAVSFDRVGLFHFAIYLGLAWPRHATTSEQEGDPIPLVCHFSGDARSVPMASIRVEDFRDVVLNSTIRVYKCVCPAAKRQRVIAESLAHVGETGYNPLTNNCEHFVRRVINRVNFSYQAFWTFAAPIIQVPRLLIGLPIGGSIASSSSSSAASGLAKVTSLCLINPEMDPVVIQLADSGLSVQVKLSFCCTKDFTGPNPGVAQDLYHCLTCGITGSKVVCKVCQLECHSGCETRVFSDSQGFCDCSHRKRLQLN